MGIKWDYCDLVVNGVQRERERENRKREAQRHG